ncbi:hypothetical protein NEMBOFW57_010503 [Staphylotrichum longicolle]|uniref:Uncharacterized protein n=1 Tax=Staphylotrichum longicolle TaxID=669026 RepID=A0AAD4EMW3_9PEZI|nr:hypothetical protein NEMBOFW57_010503 [Staphylotrichum longicolle]
MAHLPPNAAIFSPSVARAAASAAKDWSYIDAWLHRKFPGRGPPPFERNADTLRVLLALASANEAADEERTLIARLEAETLTQLRAHEQSLAQQENQTDNNNDNDNDDDNTITIDSAREAILASLETSLTRDGQTALTAMAALALQTATPLPTPAALASSLLALSTEAHTLDQTAARIQTLTAYLAAETAATAKLSAELRPPSPHHPHHHRHNDDDDDPSHSEDPTSAPAAAAAGGYHPPPSLSLTNLSTQRRIKTLAARLPEQRDKAASLARSVPLPSPTVPQLAREEEAYLSLLAHKRALDAQVRAFEGLPPDAEQARQELEGLREELTRLAGRRDEVFEGLVERETPRKGGGVRR